MLHGKQAEFSAEVARLVHSQRFREAAQLVSDECKLGLKINSDREKDYLPPLTLYLHWLLNNGHMMEAAQLLWTPTQFDPRPLYTQQVWSLFDRTSTGLIMGGASCSKSFGMGVRLFLEWLRDPEYTSVRLIGPSEDHLSTNLFSHLVSLHNSASLPMPGKINDLFIGLDRRNQVSAIKGVVIPIGKTKKAGRLQGSKRKPRPQPHPVFGPLTRMFIFLDEIENVPEGVWSDIDNVLSMYDGDPNGLKIFGAYNPMNPAAEVGQRAEPEFGWREFDKEKHFHWYSKRGWDVLRLDGEKSENVIQGRIVFPGLQTREGLGKIAKNAGGVNSPGYMTMGRGCYPEGGLELNVLPPGVMNNLKGEYIWIGSPSPVAGIDMALEGGATAVFTLGKVGQATGIKWPASVAHPNGHTEMFRDPLSHAVRPRWVAQADKQFPLPKGDTPTMAAQCIDLARRAGVKPGLCCVDRTGNGAGVHDLMKNDWSPEVIGVNYSESCTDTKILEEDSKLPGEEYPRIDSELWFALKGWAEFKCFLIHPTMETTKLFQQLSTRLYKIMAGKRRVEPKKEYKARANDSPDEADSLTLFVHAARKGASIIPSMKGDSGGNTDPMDDEWWEGQLHADHYIDPSNMTDHL